MSTQFSPPECCDYIQINHLSIMLIRIVLVFVVLLSLYMFIEIDASSTALEH